MLDDEDERTEDPKMSMTATEEQKILLYIFIGAWAGAVACILGIVILVPCCHMRVNSYNATTPRFIKRRMKEIKENMIVKTVKKKKKAPLERKLRSTNKTSLSTSQNDVLALILHSELDEEIALSPGAELESDEMKDISQAVNFDLSVIDEDSGSRSDVFCKAESDSQSEPEKRRRLSFSSKVSIDTDVSGSANCCHICLDDFKPGDVIGSSKNSNCPHMFHEECIIKWLIIPHNECPVCKSHFLVKSKKRRGRLAHVEEV